MATKGGRPENLIPANKRTKEEARELGRKGGIKSGVVRAEKKRISQMIYEYLSKNHDVVLRNADGAIINTEKLSAQELIDRSITMMLCRGNSASATIIKGMADITEGNKTVLSGELDVNTMTPEQRRARIEELEKKRKDADK